MPFAPTQNAANLLCGKTRLVYNVTFQSTVNGTYFNFYDHGAFASESYVASPWLEDLPIEDYSSLTVEEAVKLVLAKHPEAHFTFCTLRKALYPGIKIPSYYLGSTTGVTYQVDFDQNVSLVK